MHSTFCVTVIFGGCATLRRKRFPRFTTAASRLMRACVKPTTSSFTVMQESESVCFEQRVKLLAWILSAVARKGFRR